VRSGPKQPTNIPSGWKTLMETWSGAYRGGPTINKHPSIVDGVVAISMETLILL
jgi:hypothetical protein